LYKISNGSVEATDLVNLSAVTDDGDGADDADDTEDRNWPMFGDDLRNTGVNSGTGVDAPVTERWNFTLSDRVSSSPVVAGDTVYVASPDVPTLYAVNASDGSERWNFTTGYPSSSSPAVVNGTVYVGSVDNNLSAVNATDGTEVWNFPTDEDPDTPVVAGDTVYFIDGKSLYAVNASDGAERWNFTTDDWVYSYPAVAGDTVYVGSQDTSVYAVDASDGSERWNFTTGGSVESSPAVASDTVYFGSADNNLYAVNASDGTKRWNFSAEYTAWSSPAVAGDTVYFGSSDHSLYAVNESDGSERWNFTTGDDVHSSPAVVGDTVYVGSMDNNLYAVNASDGSERWNFTTGDWIWHSSPAVVNGTVYIGSYDNSLYAITEQPVPTAPMIEAPADDTYTPEEPHTIGTFHNATGVISSGDVAIRLVNVTAGNNTVVAVNDSASIPVEGDVNTTIGAGNLSGDVTVETQLYNISNGSVEATDIVNLTATDSPDHLGNVSLRLDPSARTVDAGNTTTYEVVVSNATEGLGGYNIKMILGSESVATFTNFSHRHNPTTTTTNVSASKIEASAGFAEALPGSDEYVLGMVTVSGEVAGQTALTINQTTSGVVASTEQYDIADASQSTLTVEAADVVPTLAVESASLTPGATQPVAVTLSEAPTGVSGFQLNVSVGNGSRAQFTDAAIASPFDEVEGAFDTTISSDNTTVTLSGSDVNKNIEPGATDITLATITLEGVQAGTTELTPQTPEHLQGIQNESGYPIPTTRQNGSVEVQVVSPVCDDCGVPTDPDGDGTFEDLNGNGRVDFDDPIVLFDALTSFPQPQPLDKHPGKFDQNGNGRVDFDDPITLFQDLISF